MTYNNAQIKGIIAACIAGAVILGVIGSSASSLKKKNVNFGEAARTVGRSIMGNTAKIKSPGVQGSSTVSDAISEASDKASNLFSSSGSSRGGGTKRNKKGCKRKTKGRK